MGFTENTENPTFRGGSQKTNTEGRLPKKGGLDSLQICKYKGLGNKDGGFVVGGLIPQCTLWM